MFPGNAEFSGTAAPAGMHDFAAVEALPGNAEFPGRRVFVGTSDFSEIHAFPKNVGFPGTVSPPPASSMTMTAGCAG